MVADARPLSEAFWTAPPALPPELRLVRQERLVVPRRGRGGESVFDVARVETPKGHFELVIAHRSQLLARDVPILKSRLESVIEQRRRRLAASGPLTWATVPAVAVDAATPSVRDACARAGLALFDRRGTALILAGPVYVHIEGRVPVERHPTLQVFKGRAARVVRHLLVAPGEVFHTKSLATAVNASPALAHRVVARLEREGYLERSSPRSGYRVRDPVALLRAWIDSGERAAVRTEAFYAPSTRPEALLAAQEESAARGVASAYTLASGLRGEEVYAAGLPHGAYVSGDPGPFVEKLQLRRTTPHNFLVLVPDPSADTDAGGVYASPRTLPQGRCVSLPQLALDFASLGGRGSEQADHLVEAYANSLPIVVDDDGT